MLILTVEDYTRDNLIMMLEYTVLPAIREGCISGYGWSIEGEEENDPDVDEDTLTEGQDHE